MNNDFKFKKSTQLTLYDNYVGYNKVQEIKYLIYYSSLDSIFF